MAVVNISVFNAFPQAVISNVWQIGRWVSNTRIGNTYEKISDLDVIEDEAGEMSYGNAPSAEVIVADALLYVKPEQLPTTNLNALKTAYMLFNSKTGEYFVIINAGAGKNQETGKLEHIELKIRQTEAEDVEQG